MPYTQPWVPTGPGENPNKDGAYGVANLFGPLSPEHPSLKHMTTDDTHVGDRDDDLMRW